MNNLGTWKSNHRRYFPTRLLRILVVASEAIIIGKNAIRIGKIRHVTNNSYERCFLSWYQDIVTVIILITLPSIPMPGTRKLGDDI